MTDERCPFVGILTTVDPDDPLGRVDAEVVRRRLEMHLGPYRPAAPWGLWHLPSWLGCTVVGCPSAQWHRSAAALGVLIARRWATGNLHGDIGPIHTHCTVRVNHKWAAPDLVSPAFAAGKAGSAALLKTAMEPGLLNRMHFAASP